MTLMMIKNHIKNAELCALNQLICNINLNNLNVVAHLVHSSAGAVMFVSVFYIYQQICYNMYNIHTEFQYVPIYSAY